MFKTILSKMHYWFSVLAILMLTYSSAFAQTILTGRVVDTYKDAPVAGALVSLQQANLSTLTNASGYFIFKLDNIVGDSANRFEYATAGSEFIWSSKNSINISVYNLMGQKLINEFNGNKAGIIQFSKLPEGLFITCIETANYALTYKILYQNNQLFVSKCKGPTGIISDTTLLDSLEIEADHYFTEKYKVKTNGTYYTLLQKQYNDIDYLNQLTRFESFTTLQGFPLSASFGEVNTIKVIYSLADDKIYYANSLKYNVHYNFCSQVLGYSKGHSTFNYEQYTKNPNRGIHIGVD